MLIIMKGKSTFCVYLNVHATLIYDFKTSTHSLMMTLRAYSSSPSTPSPADIQSAIACTTTSFHTPPASKKIFFYMVSPDCPEWPSILEKRSLEKHKFLMTQTKCEVSF